MPAGFDFWKLKSEEKSRAATASPYNAAAMEGERDGVGAD